MDRRMISKLDRINFNCVKAKKKNRRSTSLSLSQPHGTTPKEIFSPTLPSPISDTSFSITTFEGHGRISISNTPTPSRLPVCCRRQTLTPHHRFKSPPHSTPRNLNP
ncbi:unnamed protein product [Brassica napus]|uniref:(rape) hypothetical protein n=1 Tax=Brassica napus TaxID=3708 RepID=A0A816X4S0_BRANA|nr:unnamed protein product [Brassica napus]